MNKTTVKHLQIIPNTLLATYLQQAPKGLQQAFDALQDAEISGEGFSFYTSVSAFVDVAAYFVQSMSQKMAGTKCL